LTDLTALLMQSLAKKEKQTNTLTQLKKLQTPM